MSNIPLFIIDAELKRPLILVLFVDLLNSQWQEIPFQRATLAGRGPRPMTV